MASDYGIYHESSGIEYSFMEIQKVRDVLDALRIILGQTKNIYQPNENLSHE